MKYFFSPCVLSILFLITSCSNNDDENMLTTSPKSWMSDIVSYYDGQNISLVDICLPRSHDAGNFIETSCTFGGFECNTRTQKFSIAEQLNAGIREFDLRPLVYEDGLIYAHHYTGCPGLGCAGESFETMLNEVKGFLEINAELVILDINHFCETSNEDEVLWNLISGTLGDLLYKEATPDAVKFINKPLSEIIGLNDGKGKAIVTYEGLTDSPENRAMGKFTEYASLTTEGNYSNKFVFEEMETDQIAKFENFTNTDESIFEISWTLTQNTSMAFNCVADSSLSINSLATFANANLQNSITELIENGTIIKGKIPNVISVDLADEVVTNVCVEITKLNLATEE